MNENNDKKYVDAPMTVGRLYHYVRYRSASLCEYDDDADEKVNHHTTSRPAARLAPRRETLALDRV